MVKPAKPKRSKTPVTKKARGKSKARSVKDVSKQRSHPASPSAHEDSLWRGSLVRLFVWIGSGTLWYYTQCKTSGTTNFTLSQAFYYASQTGLNIGFTVDRIDEELCSAPSKFLTTCYCLYGVHAGSSALNHVVCSFLPQRRQPGFYVGFGLLYMLFGAVALGMYTMGFDLNASWYYSVTSLTTSGLQGPKDESKALVLTSIFALIGVPIVGRACEEAGKLFDTTSLWPITGAMKEKSN